MQPFASGPFTFAPGATSSAGGAMQRWTMHYGSDEMGWRTLPADASQADVIDAFEDARADFIRKSKRDDERKCGRRTRYEIALVESTEATGEFGKRIDSFTTSVEISGMSAGLIDDRYPTWAVAAFGNMPMSAEEFVRLSEAHAVANRALDECENLEYELSKPLDREWIAGLLPESVLADDANDWRPPTSWEIRHVVGEGSFTGVSGAKAAALIGVTPQNFRKYTARDDASTRQNISFAMWHLLLHKLGVKPA